MSTMEFRAGQAPVENKASARPSATELPVGHKPWLARYWVGKIDLRPFAAFRIAFGLFLFYDLCELFPNLRTFFSDEGVLPRVPFLGQWARAARFCLLDAFGTPQLVYVFWAISVLAVLSLAAGYHTRLAAIATFLCMASFQERLPPLFDGSDTVIRLASFWHIFVPSGNLWGVDALLAEKRGKPLDKLAGALAPRLLQLQIAWIYLCTACHKVQGSTWRNGDALHYCLHLTNVFSRPWAVSIADSAPVMLIGTWGTLVVEFAFMALVNFPAPLPEPWSERVHRWARAAGIIGVTSLHLGIAFTINVGLFSYLMPLAMFMFYDPAWTQKMVDGIARFLGPKRMGWLERTALAFPDARWENPPSQWLDEKAREFLAPFARVVLVLWFAVVTWYAVPKYIQNWVGMQLGTAAMPRWAEVSVQALDVWSSWDMFSPEPLRTDYHLTAPAEYEDGSTGNLFGGPANGPGEQRGFWFSRWFKYFENVTGGDQLLPLEWGRYICRERNFGVKPGEPRLYTFTLFKDNQVIPPIGQPWPPVSRQTVWVHRCYDKPPQPEPNVVATPAAKKP